MDLIPGIVSLLVGIAVSLYVRGLVIRSRLNGSNFLYRNKKVINAEGSSPGVMVYLISIITAIIGPFSYRLVPVNDFTYVIANIVAAVFFALSYPPFAPVTGFATLDVLEKGPTKYCVVGRVLNRRYRVMAITERPKFEIVAMAGRKRLVFEVMD